MYSILGSGKEWLANCYTHGVSATAIYFSKVLISIWLLTSTIKTEQQKYKKARRWTYITQL